MRISALFVCLLALCACSDSDSDETKGGKDAGAEAPSKIEPQLGVTADWQNHTLTIVELSKLEKGGTRADAQVDTIDLSSYAAGPLTAEITPDGKLALVSLSAGFFSLSFAGSLVGAANIPADTGLLLFIDLATKKVVGELNTGKHPMGIAITPDSKRAFVAHFGGNEIAVVDIDKRALIEKVQVGIYSEEITLDDSGSVGIFSYSAAGNFRTFSTDDVSGTLSAEVDLKGDAAGVAFFPGTKIAYMVQAPMPLTRAKGGFTIVDVSDASAPEILQDEREDVAPTAYPAVAVPERDSVVVPITAENMLKLQEIKLGKDNQREVVQTIDIAKALTFGAYSASIDAAGRVLLAVPREHFVAVVDLERGSAFTVPWDLEAAGPTDFVAIP